MSQLLIKNGGVIDAASDTDKVADVLIRHGIIAALGAAAGTDLEAPGAEFFDATGLIVAPGFVDMHVHLREPGIEHAETIDPGARAAVAGGFTSRRCMPKSLPVNDNATVTSYIVERARQYAVT